MSWKVEVLGYGETKWASNALRFETRDEGEAYASTFLAGGLGAKSSRVVPIDEPVNYVWIGGEARPIEQVN